LLCAYAFRFPLHYLTNVHSTGITGYVAGDAFVTIYNAHPDFEYSALVRTEDKANDVKEKYPSVRVVLGDLDSSELIEKEAARADIVLRTSCPKHGHSSPCR